MLCYIDILCMYCIVCDDMLCILYNILCDICIICLFVISCDMLLYNMYDTDNLIWLHLLCIMLFVPFVL